MKKYICPKCFEVVSFRDFHEWNYKYDYKDMSEQVDKLTIENSSLKDLLAANIRVIKEEIKREQEAEKSL